MLYVLYVTSISALLRSFTALSPQRLPATSRCPALEGLVLLLNCPREAQPHEATSSQQSPAPNPRGSPCVWRLTGYFALYHLPCSAKGVSRGGSKRCGSSWGHVFAVCKSHGRHWGLGTASSSAKRHFPARSCVTNGNFFVARQRSRFLLQFSSAGHGSINVAERAV